MLRRHRFLFEHIQYRCREPAILQGLFQRDFIHRIPASDIDKHCMVGERIEQSFIDDFICILCSRQNTDKIIQSPGKLH